jgi:hypothetical protein
MPRSEVGPSAPVVSEAARCQVDGCSTRVACFGRYEAGAFGFCCDVHCGHGNEDGQCIAVEYARDANVIQAALDATEARVRREHTLWSIKAEEGFMMIEEAAERITSGNAAHERGAILGITRSWLSWLRRARNGGR